MKYTSFFSATLLASLMALPVSAATLDFANLSAAWDNPAGGGGLNILSNVSAPPGLTASIRWGGNNDAANPSGYDFTYLGDPVPNPAIGVDTLFDLGTFTHYNQPITSGTAITSVTLKLTGDIRINGSVIYSGATFSFGFIHDETPNNANPCKYGDPQPCGDGVFISMLNDTDTFMFDGVEYTMHIRGFIPEGGTEASTFFFSDEGANNSATLVAKFSAAPAVVPLPAAGWLLLGGLGALAAVRRRRKAA